MKTKHTDLFKETITKILSAINEGFRKDDDHFFAGGDRMNRDEIFFLEDLKRQLEDE